MVEVYKNIFVGNEYDYYRLQEKSEWGILHCCKQPFHQKFVGYNGNLPLNHKDYMLKRIDNEMALNMVDMQIFQRNFVGFNKVMFEKAFDFLDEYTANGKKVLIHCNEGLSRSPTLAMLYLARNGVFNYKDFDTTVKEFKKIYGGYQPRANVFLTTKTLWTHFVKNNSV